MLQKMFIVINMLDIIYKDKFYSYKLYTSALKTDE